MKEDLGPRPATVPVKRRQLEAAPAVWLAEWATDEALPPSQRRRAQAERDRRKEAVVDVRVGVIVGNEGVTREQQEAVVERVRQFGATMILHPGTSSKFHQALKAVAPTKPVFEPLARYQHIIKESDAVVVAPPGPRGPVFEQAKYARHRSLPVAVIMPDGEEL